MTQDEFSIMVADTAELRSAAWRLRYEVFALELGDDRYADHELKEWRDEDDESGAPTTLVALNEEKAVVGTLRFTKLTQHRFIAAELYQFKVLSELLAMDVDILESVVGRIDRGVIASTHRRSGLFASLERSLTQIALSVGCSILVSNPELSNIASRKGLQKFGWCEYPVTGQLHGFEAQAVFKDLRHNKPGAYV